MPASARTSHASDAAPQGVAASWGQRHAHILILRAATHALLIHDAAAYVCCC